jgi:hypothetical protein
VPGVALVAHHPAGHQTFLAAFTGVGELESGATGVGVCTENGDIEILQPTSFRDRFGVEGEGMTRDGMTLGATRFAVDDIARTEAVHRQNGIASRRHGECLVVPPDVAHGATLIFETA